MTHKKIPRLEKNDLLEAIRKSEAEMNALEARIKTKAREMKHIQAIKPRSESIKIQSIAGKASTSESNSGMPYNYTNKRAQGYYDFTYR